MANLESLLNDLANLDAQHDLEGMRRIYRERRSEFWVALITAAVVWGYTLYVMQIEMTPAIMATIVSLSGGALLANLTSVLLLVVETVTFRR